MITNNTLLILASLGLFQGAFLSFYFLTLQEGRRISNVLLGLVILGLSMRVGKSVFDYFIPLQAWQRNIGISGILIAGPSLWFYGISIITKNGTISKWRYIHFVPFVLFVLLFMIIPSKGSFELYWNYGIVVLHLAIYLALSWHLLIRNRSNISTKGFHWYRNVFGI